MLLFLLKCAPNHQNNSCIEKKCYEPLPLLVISKFKPLTVKVHIEKKKIWSRLVAAAAWRQQRIIWWPFQTSRNLTKATTYKKTADSLHQQVYGWDTDKRDWLETSRKYPYRCHFGSSWWWRWKNRSKNWRSFGVGRWVTVNREI